MPLLTDFCLGLGWPWVGEFRRFRNGRYMFSNPTGLGKPHTPYCLRPGVSYIVSFLVFPLFHTSPKRHPTRHESWLLTLDTF